MMPIASIRACMVVGPTKVNPTFLSALDSASDSGEVVGSCSVVSGAGVASGRNDQTKLLQAAALAQGHRGPGVGARRLDLQSVADDAGVLHQRREPGVVVRRDEVDVEAAERLAEPRPLAQDDQPGQARLERLQREPLEHRGLAVDRPSPLVVVVGPVVADRPRAARDPVVPDHWSGHGLILSHRTDTRRSRLRRWRHEDAEALRRGQGAVPRARGGGAGRRGQADVRQPRGVRERQHVRRACSARTSASSSTRTLGRSWPRSRAAARSVPRSARWAATSRCRRRTTTRRRAPGSTGRGSTSPPSRPR